MSSARIMRARVSTAQNDLGDRFWNPKIRWRVKHAVFVELETGDGLSGLGESWCFDRSPAPLSAFLYSEVLPEILGQALDDLPDIIESLTAKATLTARHGILASALSGVDLALWDLRAKSRGLPLYQALRDDGPGQAHLYASGGLYGLGKGLDELAQELKSYVTSGFPAVKMKVGGVAPAEDVKRVAAARAGIGRDTRLIIDGVYSFDADGAAAFYEQVECFGIDAFQSPVPAADLSGMRRLCRGGIPVMGVEAEYRDELLTELIEGGAVAILQLAPIACGGPSRILTLADRLRAAGIPLTLETSSTAIATMAAAHIAGACDVVRDIEVHQLHRLFFERFPLGQHPVVSPWRLPATPGLGLAIEPARVTPSFELESPIPLRGAAPQGKVRKTGRTATSSPQPATS
ncbi:MAG: enolase C-terminal domain-like protein [Kiloniellaceae bacterium]